MGHQEEAVKLLERALTIMEVRAQKGSEHAATLACLNNLAYLHLEKGDSEKSLSLFLKVLQVRKGLLHQGTMEYMDCHPLIPHTTLTPPTKP